MNKVVIGQYLPGNSWIYKIDARAKLVGTLTMIIVLFFVDDVRVMGACAGLTVLYLVSIKLPLRKVLKSYKPMFFLFIMTLIFQLLFYRGGETVIFETKFYTLHQEALVNAGFLIVRLLLAATVSVIMTFTTTPTKLTDAMEYLMAPLRIIKVPVSDLAMTMTIAMRFIPTFIEETGKIMHAQTSRGATFNEGRLTKRVKYLVSLLIPMFVIAIKRADELANAMEARGFNPGAARTKLNPLKWRLRDSFYLLVVLSIGAAIIYLRYGNII